MICQFWPKCLKFLISKIQIQKELNASNPFARRLLSHDPSPFHNSSPIFNFQLTHSPTPSPLYRFRLPLLIKPKPHNLIPSNNLDSKWIITNSAQGAKWRSECWKSLPSFWTIQSSSPPFPAITRMTLHSFLLYPSKTSSAEACTHPQIRLRPTFARCVANSRAPQATQLQNQLLQC